MNCLPWRVINDYGSRQFRQANHLVYFRFSPLPGAAQVIQYNRHLRKALR